MTDIIAVQQPSFLPWAGAWSKYLVADHYVVYAGVKFDKYFYMHRVKMDGAWATLPIRGTSSRFDLIRDIRLSSVSMRKLASRIEQTYMCKRHPYGERLEPLVKYLSEMQGGYLLDNCLALFDILGHILNVPMVYSVDIRDRDIEDKSEKLNACIEAHTKNAPVDYVTGAGSLDYMDVSRMPSVRNVYVDKGEYRDESFLYTVATEEDPVAWIKENAKFNKAPDFVNDLTFDQVRGAGYAK